MSPDIPQWLALGAMLAGAFSLFGVALFIRGLVEAVAAFAAASALLAASFFLLEAPAAGVFELTVGAGLTAVLFLAAFTLVGGPRAAQGAEP